MSKQSKFCFLCGALTKIELAVFEAMPLVFDDRTSNKMVLAPGHSYIQKTFDALDKATKRAHRDCNVRQARSKG